MATSFDEFYAEVTELHGPLSKAELAQAHSGWTFSERLVLAFVRANSNKLRSPDLARFREAHEQLFPEKPRPSSKQNDDTSALRVMASWYAIDKARARSDPDFKPRSDRRLAREVVKLSWEDKGEEATERLRKNFDDQRESLLASLDHKSVDIVVLQLFALQEVERIFSIFGLDFFAEE